MGYAVATGHELTTAAGAEVLADGGTAVDACIAAAFAAFVAEPVLAQPLGGGFLMAVPETGAPRCLDAFVQTPRRKRPEGELDIRTITVDFGTAKQDFHIGAGTTATPCLVPGLFDAHERLGRMPMRDLIAPALRLARDGVPVNAFHGHVFELVAPILTASDGAARLFAPDGKRLSEGDTYRNPDLADALEVLAAEGPRFFTEGEVGQALAGQPGGQVTGDDLRRVLPRWRTPLQLSRAGTQIWLNPPPSLGGVQVALALTALPHRPGPALVARAMAEVARLRRETGIDGDPGRAAALLLDPALVARLTALLAEHRPATRGTTHISAADRFGQCAALTLSNGEGNGAVLPGTGIMPNNMLGEEDLVPDGPTAWAADRRLASMMCPMALRGADGAVTVLGSGGSNRIRSALLTVALGLIDHGQDLDSAVDAPRMHVEGRNLSFEDTGGEAWREALMRDWPEASVWDRPHMFFGGVHAVRRKPNGSVAAAGDPRRAGQAAVG